MPNTFKHARVFSLILAFTLLYIIQDCAFPRILGTVPSLLIPFVVSVGILEGPYMGAGFGVAAGLLIDHGANYFGFAALLLLIIGTASGLLISYFRVSVITAVVFTAVGGLFFFFTRWFFLYFLWYGGGEYVPALMGAFFAAALCFPVYYLVKKLSKKFGTLKSR